MKKSIFILTLMIIPVILPLLRKGYFPIHDDLQVMRQLQLEKCLQDGQFPCRWINDMGYGYGFPLFNYYPPLPYFLGLPFRTLGLSFIDTVKVVGLLGFVATAAAMYVTSREFWGEKGGLLSTALYLYAPYRAVNFYVRAAVNEFWASAFFPLILLGIYRIIVHKSKWWILGLALSFAGLILSHNQMLMIFSPVIVGWTLYWWWKQKSINSIPRLALGGLWGMALSAFYLFPVLLEQKYAHLETLIIGYFNYLAHFVSLKQLFLNINWGYGASIYGDGDGLSFALGYLQWIVPLLVGVGLLVSKKLRQNWQVIALLTGFFLWSIFMTHSRSTFIWKIVKPLEFLQFPWRFLSLSVFLAALVGGALGKVISKKVLALLIGLVMILNLQYFTPKEFWPDMTDEQKFTGMSWYMLTTNGIFDYLPQGASQPPADPPPGNISIVEGKGEANTLVKKTNRQEYTVEATTPLVAQIETYYFPGWRVWLDGQEQVIDPSRDEILGRMRVDVPVGTHQILAKFGNTPVRATSDAVSALAWAGVIGIMILWLKKPRLATSN